MAALAAIVSAEACGQELPQARRAAGAPCFARVQDAAVAALRAAMPLSGTVEYGGAILEVRDEFCYTAAVTQNKPTRIAYDVFTEPGERVAALYHTHPAAVRPRRAGRFSAADVASAERMRVKSFVGVAATGDIRVFDPRQARRANFGARGILARVSYTPELMEGRLLVLRSR